MAERASAARAAAYHLMMASVSAVVLPGNCVKELPKSFHRNYWEDEI